MANNNQLEILIKLAADLKGGQLTRDELEKVKRASEEAGRTGAKAAEEQETKISGLNKALGRVANQFGDLGRIVAFAFRHPVVGALTAITVGVRKVAEGAEQLNSVMTGMARSSGASLSSFGSSFHAIMLDLITSNTNFSEQQTALRTKIEAATKAIEAQKDAELMLLNARKQSELSGAKSAEDRKAVEDRFSAAEASVNIRAAENVLRTRENELATLQVEKLNQEAEARRLLGKQSIESARAEAKDIEARRQALTDELNLATAGLDKVNELMEKNPTSLVKELGSFQAVADYRSGMEGRQFLARQGLRGLDTEEARLAAGISAHSAAQKLGGQIATSESDVRGMRTRFNAQWQAQGYLQRGGATVLDAAAGADAVIGGGKANPQQQNAMKEMVRLFHLTNVGNDKIVQMLSQLNNSQMAFQNALKEVQARINAVQSQQ